MVPEGSSPAWYREFSLYSNSYLNRVLPGQLQLVQSPALLGWVSSHLQTQSSMQKGAPGQKTLTSLLLFKPATTIQAWCCGSVLESPSTATTLGMPIPLGCCGSGVVRPQSATTTLKSIPVWCCGSSVDHSLSATTPGKPIPLQCCGCRWW